MIIRLKRLDLEGLDALGRKGGIFALAIGQRQVQGIQAAAAIQYVTQLQGGAGCHELVSTIAAGQDVLAGRQNEGLRQDVVVDDGAGGSHRRSQGDTGELDLDGFVGLVNGIALHLDRNGGGGLTRDKGHRAGGGIEIGTRGGRASVQGLKVYNRIGGLRRAQGQREHQLLQDHYRLRQPTGNPLPA